MKITEDFIIHFTGNASTVSNGRKLAAKGSFFDQAQSEDGSLVFGSCAGSGKNPYQCSVDFQDEGSPIARCSCPSRQIPCKHAVGLLFSYISSGPFAVKEIPDDVVSKRGKIEKRKEKAKAPKDDQPKEMTKAKANAAAKKCRAQLDGIAMAEKLLHNIVLAGLHSIDAAQEKLLLGQVKELGNYYIGGVQAEFTELILAAKEAQQNQSFTDPVERINKCYALLRKGRTYLESKAADYDAYPEMTNTAEQDMLHSAIEEQLGYAWKLTELKEKGLYREHTELLQVAFDCYEDEGKKQWVDEGIWLALQDGAIYKTCNYRPFRAKNYVRAEDSCFQIVTVDELYLYPGDKNPRVRWDQSTLRECSAADYTNLLQFGETDFAAVIKQVKGQIKSPLNDKHPVYMLRPSGFRQTTDDKPQMVAVDQNGVSIPLRSEKFGFLLPHLSAVQIDGSGLICRFTHDPATEMLYAALLAVVSADGLIRFQY